MYIETKNLVKTFSGRNVVDGVSLRVDKGQVVGLLGPNGAGKTTSFYMIVGIERPSSGIITVDDKDITNIPMYKRAAEGIGYLPQEASIFRSMTVEDNIRAMLQTTSKKSDEIEAIVESLIEEFHIGHVRDRMGMQLSGGERRRVEIARCLALEPNFILLDEPFAGVDPIAVADIQQIILHVKNRGIGILITDHNVRETLGIVDKAYILREKGVKNVIVTLGARGCYLKNDDYSMYFDGTGFEAVDTTGGADSFISALAVYLSEGRNLLEAVEFAIYASGISVTRHGVQQALPDRRAVDIYEDEIHSQYYTRRKVKAD